MKKLTWVLVLLLSFVSSQGLAADRGQDRVYFLTGGPIDLRVPEVKWAVATFEAFMRGRFPEALTQVLHNTEWKKICDGLRKTSSRGERRIVIVGHSYGAQATTDIARCLLKSGIRLDLALTVDTIQKPFAQDPSEVPDNVVRNANFFQREDLFLKGKERHHRPDNSLQGITNVKDPGPFGISPHADIIKHVFESGQAQKVLEEALSAR
jgi:hypothetical protein